MTNQEGRGWLLPVGLAVLVTGLNAVKPAVMDDSAYLIFARHLSEHPADPYGFELFWYAKPQPAWQVLLPPVVPYWLGLGVRLFGEHLLLLKLWLFPFVLVLALAVSSLLRRFAPRWHRPMLVMTMLGPAVLPLVNMMLDVPAAGLGLAAVAVFVRSCDTGRVGLCIVAGMTAGLAMQTKYTALTVPAVVILYGLTHRRPQYAFLTVLVAVGVSAAWEVYVAREYGESHFLYHVRHQSKQDTPEAGGLRTKLVAVWKEKRELFQPMLGHLGWLGLGVGMAATAAVRAPRWWLVLAAAASVVGLTAVCVVPAQYAEIVPKKLDLPTLVFVTLGAGIGLATLAATATLLLRWPIGIRWDRDGWFLGLWLAIEFAAYFALTPFPAARRVLMLTLVGGLVAARVLSREVEYGRQPPRWLTAVGVAAGVGLFAVDCWDAQPEKILAQRAIAVCGSGNTWFSGHWGFQIYCDRAGMKLVKPERPWLPDDPPASKLRAGDLLVYPTPPEINGFYRPYDGEARFRPRPDATERVAEFVWDDWLPAQTIPDLYGGKVPVTPRRHPRLRVVVYRVTRDWVPVHIAAEP